MCYLPKWLNMHNVAIVVHSCDAYSDVWELFFTALSDQWPSCDLDIFLNTEKKTFKFNGLKLNEINACARIGNEKPWGGRLIDTLNGIHHEFIISLFDDFVLEKSVNIKKIQSCLNHMKMNPDIAVFYFNNIVGKNTDDLLFSEFELIGQRNDYKLNSGPALWRRKKMIQFTNEIDNPWAWELFGSARTYHTTDRFYCAQIKCENTFVYNYAHGGAIRRGKWVQSVVQPLIQKYKIQLDLNLRGIASESLDQGKYSLMWKIEFFILGFRMIGLKAFIFIYRIFKKKILKL